MPMRRGTHIPSDNPRQPGEDKPHVSDSPGHYERGRFKFDLVQAGGKPGLRLAREGEVVAAFDPAEIADLAAVVEAMRDFLGGSLPGRK